jgi:hypothetical protein
MGTHVTCLDASAVALDQLAHEATRRGVRGLVDPIRVDLDTWRPGTERYDLVLATCFWDPDVFRRTLHAVAANGLAAWETFEISAHGHGSDRWKLRPGEPANHLIPDFEVLIDHSITRLADGSPLRQFVARCRRSPR